MKKLLVIAALLFGAVAGAYAQTYPYTNPTYLPNAVGSSFTMASGTSGTAMVLNGIGTVSLQVSGSCTNLVGVLKASNDASTYHTINLYDATATTSASAVASISATGLYVANTSGYSRVRLDTTASSGTSCTGVMLGSPAAFTLPR